MYTINIFKEGVLSDLVNHIEKRRQKLAKMRHLSFSCKLRQFCWSYYSNLRGSTYYIMGRGRSFKSGEGEVVLIQSVPKK